MRASVAAEEAGVPTASIVLTGFMGQAEAIAKSEGMGNLAIAEYPGVLLTDSDDTLKRKVEEVLLGNIVEALTAPREEVEDITEPEPQEIIFKGNLEEVTNYFEENLWTDGLPIVPPTLHKIEEFLKFTDQSPADVIGELLPERREASIWSIAVNGVMAGCRPEHMPILIAVIEAISEPAFRVEDAGSTPGWEPLIILNGPIIKQLDFNCESGAMRVGRRANTSIGRFLRLYMRNLAGFRIPPGKTDKACLGYTFNVVLAENEDVVAEIGWEPFSVQRGFNRDENVVTVQSVVYIGPPTYSGGDRAKSHLEIIAEIIGRKTMSYWTFNFAHWARCFPIIVISPSVAKILAQDGYSKDDVGRYLYENVKTPAGENESFARQMGQSGFTFCKEVLAGNAPQVYCESTDPNRLVPVFLKPDWIGIVVSGDPDRNQSKGYVQNHEQGVPVSKRIRLPADWDKLIKGRSGTVPPFTSEKA